MTDTVDLTDEQRAMLELEQTWWRYPAAKETRIRELFDISATRYYQRLDHLIGLPAALAADPMTVRRLRRLRDVRRSARTSA